MMGLEHLTPSSLIVVISTGVALLVGLFMPQVNAELTPPYFNLATGRKIYATATCGMDTDGPELYCKLVGANTENDHIDYSVIQGQVCDYCDPSIPEKNHAPEHAIDGTESWWQSPPLSRGMKFNEVNLTIDFGQEFHVAYLFIRMGNSPRPGLWTLEKSSDYGKTWTPWQHFSDTPADCETYFGKDTYKPITNDDDVICTTEYSKIVPLENGEIPVMLLNDRPSSTNYFNSSVLQEWTRATNVRIRLLRTKNLLGHLMSVARQDPTVTRRYFYSIKDISIGGRCMCNGHADTCDVKDPKSPVRILACRCQHHTCGIQCNECCPGFEQKKWRQNTNARAFECEPCNCHGHTNECVYDEETDRKRLSLDIHGRYDGGGRCLNCQHNTEGINCNKCKSNYYRPAGKHWNETDVCHPCQCDYFYSTGNCMEETGICECRKAFKPPSCDTCAYGYYGYPNCRECECNLNGTDGYHCEAVNGECPCKINFSGHYCKQCAEGYYSFPECKACECNQIGSISNDCDLVTGQCKCLSSFGGDQCERCKHGYYNYPKCQYCDCDVQGTEDEICDKRSGQCICREGFGGSRCDQCLPGYYNYPSCKPCNCSATGSSAITCDNTGKCNCLNNFAGKQCTLCSAGYFSYPDCLACNCDVHGSEGVTCNADGQCLCLPNFDGKLCDSCKEGFYNFPNCEDCNCDPAGVIDKFAGCGSVPVGELCQCKERVSGRICNECQPLYWNLNISNPDGCEMCDCWTDGTIGYLDTCDSRTGQCTCKPHTQGRTCQDCKDGTYDLDGSTLFGCKDCNCDVGGSWRTDCDKTNGQCKCHPRITGRACTQPLTTHYFPTLYQFQYEYENGYQPSGAQVRYQFDEKVFPGFSSKGYAVFNDIQNEVRNELAVFKSSVYRIVIRYVNQNPVNVTANILIQSENPLEVDQNVKVLLRPTAIPQFVTVSGDKGKKPSAVVLDPGKYTLITKSNKNVMLDYFVLLPAAYYEASILTRKVATPCELENMEMCRHYKYASLEGFQPAVVPFVINDNGKPTNPNEFYNDPDHLTIINHIGDIPMITASQQELNYIVDVPHSGRYVFVIDYVSERSYTEPGFIRLRLGDDKDNYGSTTVYPCLYSMACRTPIIDEQIREKIFTINKEDSKPVVVYADFDDAEKVAIIAVTAIPAEEWSVNYVIPSPVCVIHNEQCVTPKFRSVPDSKKIEFETDHDDRITLNKPPYAVLDERVKLIYLDNREGEENTIVIDSKVSEPRNYVILVKYYQPHHPNYHVLYTLTAGRNQYDGKFDVNHCPSSAGCRGVIRPSGDEWWFNIEDDFKFTITNNRPQGLWLDYLIVVPVDQYNDDLLVEETFDQTKEFIQECGQEHFFITHNASDFCKKAVFSLTADYNGGALPCNCDYAGSTSFECHPFGGQCQCKPNIINRQCSACRTGYYGFPNCKPCSCPSTATCEPHTGECVCPPNVMGANCDKCVPNTYGYHQIIGCEDCNCNLLGVAHGNTQCDMLNGSCDCRQNIEGRACDTCVSGYFDFPRCDKCACNVAGTELEICDKVDGACFCKKNVVGRDCDQCMEGTYNLQYVNPDGCTTCFCFGKTSRCESAYLRIFNVSLLTNVSLNTANFNENFVNFDVWDIPPEELFINDTTIQADFSFAGINVFHDESVVFFGVLDYLAGQNSHISAYGGELVYSLYYSTGFSGKPLIAPDVILVSKDHILVHQSYEQPSSNQIFKNRVHMVENNFLTQDGKPVSRADFMMALRNLVMIYIRANYWQQTLIAQLSNVYLTLADDNNDDHNQRGYEFLAVEKCHCPPGYSGMSCEDCAPGYYRDPNGPYGGYCIPCECNGHADTCDCVTGICEDCKHYTTGDHCDMCIEGYYGNATYGSPHDCMICACPLPIPGNNFAIGCEISDAGDEIHCDCMPGHTGPRCEFCSNGYYGHPQTPGDYCKPCECSGNINPEEPGSCDTLTGECLRCLNNTFGVACNLCAPGFYGDAVDLKNCQSCDCEELGTLQCDPFVGDCKCHDNVIGSRCDRCKPDHYGYDSGAGCRTCECAIASNSTQCDDHTGKCACKPGVTGRQCDRCAVDHWKYTKDGCTPCNCNQGFSRGFGCNPLSGQCECLPGVIGDRCDACPHRWVLRKDEGCFECDSCHHALLDITDDLLYKIDPVVDEFQSVALAFFTNQKLTYFDELAEKLVPEIQNLDPKSVNLDPSRSTVSDLETETKMYLKQVNLTIDNAEDSRLMAGALLVNGSRLREEATKSVNEARGAINSVELLSRNLDTAAGTKIDAALAEAQEYLNHINATSIDLEKNELVLKKATDLLHEISKLIQPTKAQNRSLNMLKDEIGEFSDKLEDLYNWSFVAANRSAEVERLNTLNKMAFENSKFDTVMDQQNEAEKNIADANHLHTNGDITLTEIDAKVTDLVEALNGMQELNKQIDVDLPDMEKKSIEASKEVLQAEVKAAELEVRAQDLSEQYAHMTSSAEPALRAATAYQDIVDAVSSAQQFTKDAKYAAGNATEKTNGVEDRAGVADHDSAELLQKARDSLIKVQSNLEPRLNASAAKVEEISKLNEDTEKHLKDVNIAMEALPADSQRDLWKSSNENASDALGIMKDVLDILEPVVKQTTKELDQARNISKDIDLTNKDITQVQNHLNSVESYIPELNTLADDLDEQQAKVEKVGQELGAGIASLKQQIETARQLANSIKVGVKFVPSTILELKPPETVPLLATKSKVSTYFKTENPNGFLLYLGNDNKTATTVPTTSKNDDFMALEIVNGYPILTMDLGKGPERITNEKFVADGNWYQAIVERTGPNVKLTVREELDDGRFKEHVKEEILPGANNVFNVDRNSRLFVGGYPGPSDFTPPEDIHSSSFIGEIEDLRIGDEDVGLWNFVYGEDNTQGSVQRDKLITETIPPTGYRFSGNGHVVLKATPYNFKTRSSIQFSFKADKDAENGLMFFYGRNNHFMSVELVDGTVFFRYQLGDYLVSSGSSDKYNDNEWHRVVAERDGRRGLLKVDDMLIFQEEAPQQADETMPAFKRMFFGGYPGRRNHSLIVEHDFNGCIDDVTIAGNKVDLSQHINAVGAKPGCPKKFSTVLGYPPHEYGFLRIANLNSDNKLDVNLKLKTRQKDGIVFYGTNHDQSATVGLTMEDGYLILRSMGSELMSDMHKLNDGEDHVVNIVHDENQLRMTIDDDEDKRLSYPPEPLYIHMGDIFFGGLPENFILPRGALSNSAYYLGCISDVTVNGEIINFADNVEKKNGNINNCPSDILAYDISAVPIYYHGGENELIESVDTKEQERPSIIFRPTPKTTASSTTSRTTISATTKTEAPYYVPRTTQTPTDVTYYTSEKPELIEGIIFETDDKEVSHKPPIQLPERRKPEDPRCQLPIYPNYDVDFTTSGYRFFSVREQRLEVNSLSAKLRRHHSVTFSFRTDYPEGLLFYASDKYHTDYIAVFLNEGRIYHQMHLGVLVANISSAEELNDGEWHTVQFVRGNRKVSLIIDDVEQEPLVELEEKTPRPLVIEFPIFFGGIRKYVEESVRQNIERIGNTSYYNGCLRNIKVNGASLEKELLTYHVVPCSEQIEPGYFFNKPTGYVKLFDRFTVGTDFSLSFDFRPRDPDGLLFSVHGKNTYMILELIDNRLWFTVKSDSKNIVTTNYTLPDDGSYCDGKWRNVHAVKSKFVITISVDYISAKPGVGTEGSTTTKTNRPMFLGGHQAFNKAPGLKTKKTFKGCIRNIQVNKKPVRITPNLVNGEIWQGVCPLE